MCQITVASTVQRVVSLLTKQHMLSALVLRGQACERAKAEFEKEESRQFLGLKGESEMRRRERGDWDVLNPDIFSEGKWKKTLVIHKEKTHKDNNAPLAISAYRWADERA